MSGARLSRLTALGFRSGRSSGARARRASSGLTLVELAIALGVLAIAVGCLVEVLAAVSVGHGRLANRQRAFQTARHVAERVIRCSGDWQALCAEYDSLPDVAVTAEDGDGDPNSGWAKITVRVDVPAVRGGRAEEATLVFGRPKS